MSQYEVAAINHDGDVVVSVKWDNITDAADSFMGLVQGSGGDFKQGHIKLLLTLLLGDFRTNNFQVVAPDEQTVFTIIKL